jgi:hypothetical protein
MRGMGRRGEERIGKGNELTFTHGISRNLVNDFHDLWDLISR